MWYLVIPFFTKNPEIFVTSVSLNGIPSIQMKRIFRCRGKSFQLTRKQKKNTKISFIISTVFLRRVCLFFYAFFSCETSCRNIWAIVLWCNIRLHCMEYHICYVDVVDGLLVAIFVSYGTFVSFLVFLLFSVYEHWKFIGTGTK